MKKKIMLAQIKKKLTCWNYNWIDRMLINFLTLLRFRLVDIVVTAVTTCSYKTTYYDCNNHTANYCPNDVICIAFFQDIHLLLIMFFLTHNKTRNKFELVFWILFVWQLVLFLIIRIWIIFKLILEIFSSFRNASYCFLII